MTGFLIRARQKQLIQAKLGEITRKTDNLADAIAEADDKGRRDLLREKLKAALDQKESLEKAPRERPTRSIDPAWRERIPRSARYLPPKGGKLNDQIIAEGYPQSIWHFLTQCCT